MFDRSSRTAFARSTMTPGPGAHDPQLAQKPSRPSHAPFSTSTRRMDDGRRSALQKSRVPPPTQYLIHGRLGNTHAATSHAAPPFSTQASRFTYRDSGVPGVGAYELEDGRPATSIATVRRLQKPVPFGTTADAHAADTKVRKVEFAAPRQSAPSIPSALDYGYDVRSDGVLVQQKPPPSRVPLPTLPGPGEYRPEDSLEPASRKRSASLRFSVSRVGRVDFASLMPATPGPGYYNPRRAEEAPSPTSKLPTSTMSSRSRRGVEVIVGRMATGSRVGPGTHFDAANQSSFRPRSMSRARTQHFGSTSDRFRPNSRAGTAPAPGSYEVASSAEQRVKSARAAAERIAALWESRTRGMSAIGPSAQFGSEHHGRRSRSPPASPRYTGQPLAEEPMEPNQQRETEAQDIVRPMPYPAPVFLSSAPRFGPANLEALRMPPPGAYFRGDHASERASSAHWEQTDATAPFYSAAPRFGPGSLFPDEPLAAPAGSIGPGTYAPDVVPSARTLASKSRPSSVFRSRSARAQRQPDDLLTAEAFLSYNTATEFVKRPLSSSAQRGAFDALASRRPEPGPRTDLPGPGAYNVDQPRVDALAVKLKLSSRARTASAERRPPPAEDASKLPVAAFPIAPRFPIDAARASLPGPGTYEADATQPRTHRTFNVVLASAEARALATKAMLGTGTVGGRASLRSPTSAATPQSPITFQA